MTKSLFFIFVLFVSPLQALELPAKDFFVCLQKTAAKIKSRTVRVHQFPNENKCAVVYSVKGKDQMVFYGGWLSFCEKKAKQVVSNLEKGLWQCTNQKNQVEVFYSFSST